MTTGVGRGAADGGAYCNYTAAARRLRAAERLAAARSDDADYWKACCPMVVAKAAALRGEKSFAPLP